MTLRNLAHRLSISPFQQKAILAGGDIFLFLLSFMITFALWTDKVSYYFNVAFSKESVIFITPLSIFFFFAMIGGVYRLDNFTSFRKLANPILKYGVTIIIVYGFICICSPHFPALRGVFIYYIGVSLSFLVGWRYLLFATSMNLFCKRRCIILGEKNEVQKVANLLAEYPLYEVVGLSDTHGNTQYKGLLGEKNLLTLVDTDGLHEIVTAKNTSMSADNGRILLQCMERGVSITSFPLLYEKITRKIPIDFTDRQQLLFITLSGTKDMKLYTLSKRIFDVVGGTIGLLGFGLILPFIALAIKLDSPGPIFYRQERVGKNGRTFMLLKLRTMVIGAEKDGKALWADKNDARVTRVGRWLRKMRLDEFPQCWNILRGEMSIVGPRPERPEFENYLCKKIPFYLMRHSVKPGMAGWAIINHDYVDSVDTAKVRFEYDLYYTKHQSLWFDAMIFLQCFGRLFLMKGR
jgi:exopolysaccharide biosynthesis polyprenyl glycosylphosphotransferase